jgi:catechol 2,3-dioxygenase-like lactoylglutathione lyase family enzyme
VRLHHVGFVVADPERFRKNLPVSSLRNELYDPYQKAWLALVDTEGSYIELITPKERESFTWNFLQKGGGFHHLCYEVDSYEAAKRSILEQRMVVAHERVYAPLLERWVMFARDRNRMMVEFAWHE